MKKDTSWSIKTSGKGSEEKQYAIRWNGGALEWLRPNNGVYFVTEEYGDMDADNAYLDFVINEG